MTGADEPEPAIGGRTENEVVTPEKAESRGDMTGMERRDVGPDEHHRTDPAGFERAPHPKPEIACALPGGLYPAAPTTGAAAGLVGCHCDPQTPTPVFSETAQQQRDHRPLEAKRCRIAYIARQTSLAGPEQRRPHEQNESAPHQP